MATTTAERPITTGEAPWFSGVQNFTGYMKVAHGILADAAASGKRWRVLDIPAGKGQFADAVRALAHEVVCADINRQRDDYVYADMNSTLPFDDDAFDCAVCMEGIEHLIDPNNLIAELIRVVRPGGRVIISTPNVQNFYSRIRFLFTATDYQFNWSELRDLPPGAMEDRFHISPVSYFRLRYIADYFGADVESVHGDRWKKKILLPVYLLIDALGWPWRRAIFFSKKAAKWPERNRRMYQHLTSPALKYARTMIVVLRKR